jgi:hypothetical protein
MDINPEFTGKQSDCIKALFDDNTRQILYGGSAGGGKSWVGASWLIIMSLKYPGTRYLMGRSKLDALKKTTLLTFFEVCQAWNIKANVHYKYNAQSNVITFFNDSQIILKDLFLYPSDRNFDSLGSLEITGAFIDEANQITEKAKNVVASRIRYKLDENNLVPKMLMTCNPAKNWVYTEFYKPAIENRIREGFMFIPALVTDNKFISKHYEEQLKGLDIVSQQRLLYGNWEYDDSDDILIEYDAILRSFDSKVDEGERYITCDVARFGKDKSVVILWNGLNAVSFKTFDTNTITQLAEYITTLQRDYSVNLGNIIVDEDGVGGGLKDILRCKGFTNNARALKGENYTNLKTQVYYKMASMMNKGQVSLSAKDIELKNTIIQELEQVKRTKIDSDAKLSMLSKDKVKEMLGRSPDYSDAIAMRFYYEIRSNVGRYSLI